MLFRAVPCTAIPVLLTAGADTKKIRVSRTARNFGLEPLAVVQGQCHALAFACEEPGA